MTLRSPFRPRPALVRLDDRLVPAVLWVTSTEDSGRGTLREALGLANDGDEIRFDDSLYDQAVHLTTGQLVIEDNVTISGLGADHLAVLRDNVFPDGTLTPAFRIFEVAPKVSVTIADLTVRDGRLGQVYATDPIVANASGGGIWNREAASLALNDTLVSFNFALGTAAYAQGGGIRNDGVAVLTDSTVHNNFATGGTAIYPGRYIDDGGAGIENWGNLTLDRAVVTGNMVGFLRDTFPDPPPAPIGYVSGNAGGAGISSTAGSFLGLTRSVVSANTVSADSVDGQPVGTSLGGGLALAGSADIADSLVDQNYANHGPKIGRAGFALGAGVHVGPTGDLVMTRSAITNNFAHADRSRAGGLYNLGRSVLTNCTIANNETTWVTVPPRLRYNQFGGGIAVEGGEVTLAYCSVEYNKATTYFPNGVPGNGVAEGGGAYVGPNGILFSDDTVYAWNQAGAAPAPFAEHPDTPGQDVFGQVKSMGYNFARNADESTGWDGTDLGGTTPAPLDPLTGPLQDNGGPWLGQSSMRRRAFSFEALNGSPLLQSGNPATAPATDQRTVARDVGRPNRGAYEATASQFLVETDSWGNQVFAGSPFNVTVTAADPYGKTVYTYRGTVTFSTTDPDPNVSLPADYQFTAADAGWVTFYSGVTLWTPGTQRLTVRDVTEPSIEGILDLEVQWW
jgi:hypothetical protein